MARQPRKDKRPTLSLSFYSVFSPLSRSAEPWNRVFSFRVTFAANIAETEK